MSQNEKPVFFFDIDNCLYPKSYKIQHMMSDLIDKYFQDHLALSQEEANDLHLKYYREYGLAIEGLVRHHKVDPLEYNAKVDDALPLEDIIKPNPELRKLLEDIDTSKVRMWLFTNAYVTHGTKVVKLLEIDDLFEDMTYCDYGSDKFYCKPHAEMFDKAMEQAGVKLNENCYFVDDSFINTKAAQERGWHTAHLLDPEDPEPPTRAAKHQIRSLEELRDIFPHLFKSKSTVNGTV
ncbi:pyrimidine 5-nucleotidase [Karstenula rhodostoma CBS 690.94]|uniref:Pyrimidine 5-nucleotidase n=1 Tax=Karstenula rhodostoma CBS 690.94 TaxID=1392251 RepID=A0A9P4PVD6_9PLEO|nr:pyrimidine 5-nucleotidase [Karstenula rhodostoma CBS 690.94]